MQNVLKIGGYARVSHEEQKKYGFSINAQIETIKKWVEKKEYQLVNIYVDEGFSAGNMQRPQLQQMLKDLDQLDAIVFTRLDRLSRNVFEANKILGILEKNNVSIISILEENIDTTTSNGRLMFNLQVTLAQHEIDRGSERIKAVFDYKVKDGQPITGTQPYGYKIAVIDGKKKVIFDDKVMHIVVDSFDYFGIHHSVRQTMFYINDKYNINRAYSSYKRLFKNKFYTGCYKNNPNYCPAYITLQQYNLNQIHLKDNLKVRENKRVYLFSNLLKCPICGNKMTGYRATTNKSWYRCNKQHTEKICTFNKHIREEVVEDFLLENIESEFRKYQLLFEKKAQKKDPTKRINEIKKEQDNLNYLFRKSRISVNDYELEYEKLETELKSLQNNKPIPKKENIFKDNWKDIYSRLSNEKKRTIWRNMMSHIEIQEDKSIKIIF